MSHTGDAAAESAVPSSSSRAQTVVPLADALPGLVRLGCSSWSFPGWNGLVYGGVFPGAVLSRRGLLAYAAHPLMRTVGLDRTYYAPMSAEEYGHLAAQTPEGFRFLVKAHQELLRPPGYGQPGGERPAGVFGRAAIDVFLDPGYAIDRIIAPTCAGLGARLGPLLFQFSPMRLARAMQARTIEQGLGVFMRRLEHFLSRLPDLHRVSAACVDATYALEFRNPEVLCPEYLTLVRGVRATGVRIEHTFSIHPTMPTPRRQASLLGDLMGDVVGGTLVARWLLHEGQEYENAKHRYEPFDAIVDRDDASREMLAEMVSLAVMHGRPAYVIINNKAEGSAPLSVENLARSIAERLGRGGAGPDAGG
ncbi:MAG: DUF72 domain-containing protein [Phycisphaerales bacterium]|nr:DUF72 domain-containing protein [Phycisphaeraceae bacterium]